MAKKSQYSKYFGRQCTDDSGRVFVIIGTKGKRAMVKYINYDDVKSTIAWDKVIGWLVPTKKEKTAQVNFPAQPTKDMWDYEYEVSQLVKDGTSESEAVYQIEQKYHLHGQLWYHHYDVRRAGVRMEDWTVFLRTHKPVFFCRAEMMCGKWKFMLACHRNIYTNPLETFEDCLIMTIARFKTLGEPYYPLEETKEYLEYMARKRMELYGI